MRGSRALCLPDKSFHALHLAPNKLTRSHGRRRHGQGPLAAAARARAGVCCAAMYSMLHRAALHSDCAAVYSMLQASGTLTEWIERAGSCRGNAGKHEQAGGAAEATKTASASRDAPGWQGASDLLRTSLLTHSILLTGMRGTARLCDKAVRSVTGCATRL